MTGTRWQRIDLEKIKATLGAVLKMDTKTDKFTNNPDANKFLTLNIANHLSCLSRSDAIGVRVEATPRRLEVAATPSSPYFWR